jgi:hypothetical protein
MKFLREEKATSGDQSQLDLISKGAIILCRQSSRDEYLFVIRVGAAIPADATRATLAAVDTRLAEAKERATRPALRAPRINMLFSLAAAQKPHWTCCDN